MTPTDLGLTVLSDTWAQLYCLPSVDGTAPITYVLQRQQGAGAWATVMPIEPGAAVYDHGLAPGQSYSWRVLQTDSSSPPQTAYSNTVSGTSLAARTLATYTLGSAGLSTIVNGTQPLDSSGNPQYFPHGRAFWDEAYGMYFMVCGDYHSSVSGSQNLLGFASRDLINWTPFGALCGDVINGVTYYHSGGSPTLIPGPRDGYYYLFNLCRLSSSDSEGELIILRSPNPMGPYTYWSNPTISGTQGDIQAYLDYDGSVWWLYTPGGSGGTVSIVQVASDFTAVTGAVYAYPTITNGMEGPAPFRVNRNFILHCSLTTGWYWNPNYAMVCTGPTAVASATQWPNSSLYTTAAHLLGAPGGVAGAYGGAPNGYGQYTTSNENPGIDPQSSYGTQSCAVLWSRTGQAIALMSRWSSTGDNTSTYVWLPISFNGSNDPLIAFPVSTDGQFTPAVAVGYTLTGPSTVVAGEPATFTLTPTAAATDTLQPYDFGAGGETSAPYLSLAGSSSPITFQYTPPAAGTFEVGVSSAAGGAVAGSPFTLTAAPPTGGGRVLLEDGSGLLLEDDTDLLLEDGPAPAEGGVLLEDGSGLLLEDGSDVLLEGGAVVAQTFRQALVAKLGSIPELTAIVGSSIYPTAIPEDHDLGDDGPALVYTIVTNPRGHVLTGADGTSAAKVRFEATSYQFSAADSITLALWNAIDGEPDSWGDGSCVITSVSHQDEQDLHTPPKAGTDQWTYRIVSDYLIRHRTGFPTLS